MNLKIKIKLDDQVIVNQKGKYISDFDNLFKDLKKKFNEGHK